MFVNKWIIITNCIVRLIAWKMLHHAEHHGYLKAPFHKLPELHTLAAEHLQVTQDG